MKNITKSLAAFGILATVAACATPPEPQVIYAQPTYDKYGNAECSEPGRGTATSSTGAQLPPCVPDDGCVNGYTVGANSVPCDPTSGRPTQGGGPSTPRNANAGGPVI